MLGAEKVDENKAAIEVVVLNFECCKKLELSHSNTAVTTGLVATCSISVEPFGDKAP